MTNTSAYNPPTCDEIRTLLRVGDLSTSVAGKLLDVKARQVRRWTGGDSRMPWGALCTLIALRFGRVLEGPAKWRGGVADILLGPATLYVVEFDPPREHQAPVWGTKELAEHHREAVTRAWVGTVTVRALDLGHGSEEEGVSGATEQKT